jgi:hypothetical protein
MTDPSDEMLATIEARQVENTRRSAAARAACHTTACEAMRRDAALSRGVSADLAGLTLSDLTEAERARSELIAADAEWRAAETALGDAVTAEAAARSGGRFSEVPRLDEEVQLARTRVGEAEAAWLAERDTTIAQSAAARSAAVVVVEEGTRVPPPTDIGPGMGRGIRLVEGRVEAVVPPPGMAVSLPPTSSGRPLQE